MSELEKKVLLMQLQYEIMIMEMEKFEKQLKEMNHG